MLLLEPPPLDEAAEVDLEGEAVEVEEEEEPAPLRFELLELERGSEGTGEG